jgi:AcrR family transcriptional regulator
VPTQRSGAGDPARTLQLLWRDPAAIPRHGPRQGLSIDAVVDAATELADAESLDAVTMRRVAQALGVAPMTLYTYVPGKAELLDLMLDAAYARMPRTGTSGRPWRPRLAAVAAENRALFATHPWAATVSTIRPPLGPGQMAKYEHELSAFDDLGLDDVTVDDCLTYLLTFVQAAARAAADARDGQRDSALDDQQWWAANQPLLARVFDADAYPTAARVGAAAGAAHGSTYDPGHAYDFGLQRVLDGLAALIDAAADRGPGRPGRESRG